MELKRIYFFHTDKIYITLYEVYKIELDSTNYVNISWIKSNEYAYHPTNRQGFVAVIF